MNSRVSCFMLIGFALLVVGLAGGCGQQQASENIWVRYTSGNELVSSYVTGIAFDSLGNVYVASRGFPGGSARGGVSKYDGSKWIKYSSGEGFPTDYVWSIAVDKNNAVWVGTDNGALKFTDFNNKKWEWVGPTGKDVWRIAIDDSDNKWFGTSDGLFMYNNNSWTNYSTSNGIVDNYIECIRFDSSKNIWIGTCGGISKFDGSKWTNYSTAEGLSGDLVRTLIIDNSNNVWCGVSTSSENKICRLNSNGSWSYYGSSEGIPASVFWVFSSAVDKNGNIWFGTDEGLFKFDGNKFINYTIADSQNDPVRLIWELAADRNNMWIGTDNGVYRYSGD